MRKENTFYAINPDPYTLAKKSISEDGNLVGTKSLRTAVSAGPRQVWLEGGPYRRHNTTLPIFSGGNQTIILYLDTKPYHKNGLHGSRLKKGKFTRINQLIH